MLLFLLVSFSIVNLLIAMTRCSKSNGVPQNINDATAIVVINTITGIKVVATNGEMQKTTTSCNC